VNASQRVRVHQGRIYYRELDRTEIDVALLLGLDGVPVLRPALRAQRNLRVRGAILWVVSVDLSKFSKPWKWVTVLAKNISVGCW
jgi:hypothetical protein